MPKTSDENESVLDELDRTLVFAFALRVEMGREPALIKLRELAEQAREAARHHPVGLRRLGKSDQFGFAPELVSRVMNGLQTAVADQAPPAPPDLDQKWAYMPPALSGAELDLAHEDGIEYLARIAAEIVEQVDSGFPAEAKPFISAAQFEAVSRRVLANTSTASAVPIHIPSLVGLLHTNFLDRVAGRPPLAFRELLARYCESAVREHLAAVEESFVTRTIQHLLPEAGGISIPLAEHYNWASLCWLFPSARVLLDVYASLNVSQAVVDSKFKPPAGADAFKPLPAQDFLSLCRNMTPSPLRKGGTQRYFDTDRCDIRIDGRALQKHAMMAISYTEPLPDIEEATTRFGVYLLNNRRNYCRATRTRFSKEEGETLARIGGKADSLGRLPRVLLHDKSSVLGRLCSLMALEMQLDARFEGLSSKARALTIGEWLLEAGFEYSNESIRKSCEGLGRTVDIVQSHLQGL